MDRKAVVGDSVTGWIIKFTLIIIVVISVITMVNMSVNEKVDTFEVDSTLFYHKVFGNDIAYVDGDTGRTDLGVIDYDKMVGDPGFLDTLLGDSSRLAANFSVVGKTLKADVYYHKSDFKHLLVYFKANAKSSVKGTFIGVPVTIRSDDLKKQEQGMLTVTILSPE